jgi:hypothetical protein
MRVHPASVLAPVNNTPAQGRGQVTAFVQKFKFGSPRYDFNSPNEQRGMSYASFIENRYTDSLFGNGSRNTLFFYPSKSIAIIPLLLRAISSGSESGSDSNADSTQSSFELRDELRPLRQ